MNISMNTQEGVNPKELVIGLFDAIKCASATVKGVKLTLTPMEVLRLNEYIQTIDKLDIHWDSELIELPFE